MQSVFGKMGESVGAVVGMGGEWQKLKIVVSFSERVKSPFSGEFLVIQENEEPRRRLLCFVEEPAYGDYSTTEQTREKILVDKYIRDLANVGAELSEEEKKTLLYRTYTVKVLGEIINENGKEKVKTVYRFLPELTATCRYPTDAEYRVILSAGISSDEEAVEIGKLAIGDSVCNDIPVKFDPSKFITIVRGSSNEVVETTGRRTAILARTGYGKSNLSKVILHHIGKMKVPVLIGDLNGEYAFSSSQGKGLADDPNIRERLVVYTNKPVPSNYSDVFTRPLKIDFSKAYPSDISYLIDSTMELSGAQQLENISHKVWERFIKYYDEADNKLQVLKDFIYGKNQSKNKKAVNKKGKKEEEEEVNEQETTDSDNETLGITNQASKNAVYWRLKILMTKLHEAGGPDLINEVLLHLANNMIVVLDLSATDSKIGLDIMGMILQGLFKNNSDGFTGDRRTMIPSIVVLEEAQNVLSPSAIKNESSIYVRAAKEGRKLGISLIFITQQPGSISNAILSQSDNYFVMHVLNKEDVDALVKANNHYGGIISRFLQNEALMGNAYIYSAPYQPYVFPAAITKFEDLTPSSPDYKEHKYDHFTTKLIDKLKSENLRHQNGLNFILMGRLQHIVASLVEPNHTWLETSQSGDKVIRYNYALAIMQGVVPFYGLTGKVQKAEVNGVTKTVWVPNETTLQRIWQKADKLIY